MDAKQKFKNLGEIKIPIDADLNEVPLKETIGYQDIKHYIEQLEKQLVLKDKALDKACDMLSKMKEATDCWEFEKCPFRTECEEDSSITSEELCYSKNKWKEWCLKDE